MPLIVTFFWGLTPAPGMLLIPLFAFVTALGFAGFGMTMAAIVAKIDQFNYVTSGGILPAYMADIPLISANLRNTAALSAVMRL